MVRSVRQRLPPRDLTESTRVTTDSPAPAITLHLVPEERWLADDGGSDYTPERFAEEGFIHTTLGDDEVLAVGNRYYVADPRPHLVLTVALDRLAAPWRFDEAGPLYPHVYGPLNRDAVVGVRRIRRDVDGRFTGIDPYP